MALIDTLRRLWRGPIETYYIVTDLSQPWRLRLDLEQGKVLPSGLFSKLRTIWHVLTRDRKHTILHVQGWGLSVLLIAMVMAKSLRIPVAVKSDTSEGRWDRYWVPRTIKMLLYPLVFRLPNRFLPAGTRQVRYLKRFGAKHERIRIAQMTVDICAIRHFCSKDRDKVRSAARTRWGMSPDDCVVLYVGRLEPYKGILELLCAFGHAAEEENALRLAVAGSGTLQFRVEEIAANPDCRVSYLGRLSGEDVLRAYLAADLLVVPSLFEPWGLVVNEAMACGLPVIASDRVGCADDLIRHGETGLIVPGGDQTKLSSAILQLVRDALERRRMGKAAESLISHWTLQNEARNFMSVWGEIAQC